MATPCPPEPIDQGKPVEEQREELMDLIEENTNAKKDAKKDIREDNIDRANTDLSDLESDIDVSESYSDESYDESEEEVSDSEKPKPVKHHPPKLQIKNRPKRPPRKPRRKPRRAKNLLQKKRKRKNPPLLKKKPQIKKLKRNSSFLFSFSSRIHPAFQQSPIYFSPKECWPGHRWAFG